MTTEQIREIFNTVIENAKNSDKVANLELCREYFTNPDFKKFLEDTTFAINQVKA